MKKLVKMRAEHGWRAATRNRRARYIISAFNHGHRMLRWLKASETMTGVTLLKTDGVGRAYELDFRLGVAVAIAADTGRRIQAISKLRTENVSLEIVETRSGSEVEVMRIEFPGEVEKVGITSWAFVTESTRELIEKLAATEAVQRSGFLFPNRQHLTFRAAKNEKSPIRPAAVRDMTELFYEAERQAGIEHVEGRAFHGIKRRAVTETTRKGSLDVAAQQSGTSAHVIQTIYLQLEAQGAAFVVDELEQRRRRKLA